jgi:hypothetical protein
MANLIADYRTDIDNLLATAVDSSTWTTAIKDQGLRMALDELNDHLIYEASFTVTIAGYEQDLSAIVGLNQVRLVAYPWVDGSDFSGCLAEWRVTGINKIYLTRVQPAVGEILRVRYSKSHTISGLDAAVATTVADRDRSLVGWWGAAFACDLRIRQISENPALPAAAAGTLRLTSAQYKGRATEMMSHVPVLGRTRWGSIGLE